MQQTETPAIHQANLDAVAAEIKKVQQLSGSGSRNAEQRNSRPRPQQQQQPGRKEGGGGGGGHGPSRNKGRRSSGRQGRP